MAKRSVEKHFNDKQLEFVNFILSKYEVDGVWELGIEKLNSMITLKYGTPQKAKQEIGQAKEIRQLFSDFQQYLYKTA